MGDRVMLFAPMAVEDEGEPSSAIAAPQSEAR